MFWKFEDAAQPCVSRAMPESEMSLPDRNLMPTRHLAEDSSLQWVAKFFFRHSVVLEWNIYITAAVDTASRELATIHNIRELEFVQRK